MRRYRTSDEPHATVDGDANEMVKSNSTCAAFDHDVDHISFPDNYSLFLAAGDGDAQGAHDKGYKPTGYRARILKQPFRSSAEEEWFRMGFKEWLQTDRSSHPEWGSSVQGAVRLADIVPYNRDDSHLLSKVALVHAGVTSIEVDAVVNAANERCMGGGGVDGAIHDAAGPLLERECATFDGCLTGQTRLTKGYRLPAKFVLHTVGPMGRKPALLRSCYRGCMSLAKHHGLRSVAFCCVSTGIFGYPLEAATEVALNEVLSFLKQNMDSFDMMCFACFTDREYEVYERLLPVAYRVVMSSDLEGQSQSTVADDTNDDL